MKSVTAIFKVLFLSLCIIANTHLAYAQTASILPQGKTQFLDNNGKPLASGTVDFYIPSTTTRKTTWQNSGETISNTNPVVLDGGGRAIIYGDGNYRMVVKDRLGNLIYDQLTSSTGSGSTPSTATGDGDLVGTIKPWAGMTAPNQYLFTYGQEVSRTLYSTLFTAITSSQIAFCTSASPTLTGLSDTSNFWVGMSLEISCVAPGFTTVVSKTSSTVTMATNANVTSSTTAVFFPWGRGNGSTTFNLPDLRGVVLAGNNIMGGVSGSNLTTTYFGSTDPNSSGALGGSQSTTMTAANMEGHKHAVYAGVETHSHTGGQASSQTGFSGGTPSTLWFGSANSTGSSATGLTVRDAPSGAGTSSVTAPTGGGIASSATVAAVGSGYTNGSQTITVSGGTCTTQPQFTVTVSGNAFSGTPSLLTAGSCTIAPTNPASTTGGGGTGGTLNVTYSAQPVSRIQPTITSNFIIKVTPDSNSATASGVTSLGSMTGDIACGTGLLCTGNNISVTSVALIVGTTQITSGTNTRVLFNNAGALGEYTISGSGNVAMTTSPVFTTPSLGVATGTSLALTTSSANALAVGPNGTTNPAFNVDASTASSATGLNIKSAAAAAGLAVSVLSSGTNENLTINAKGSGTINIGNTSTGNVVLGSGGGSVLSGSLVVSATVASGTSALGTSLIASGACASVVTTAASGTATTDVIDFGFNGDPTATTGYVPPNMLAIVAYPSANNVNFKVCNNTAGSITPSAITLNWKVRR